MPYNTFINSNTLTNYNRNSQNHWRKNKSSKRGGWRLFGGVSCLALVMVASKLFSSGIGSEESIRHGHLHGIGLDLRLHLHLHLHRGKDNCNCNRFHRGTTLPRPIRMHTRMEIMIRTMVQEMDMDTDMVVVEGLIMEMDTIVIPIAIAGITILNSNSNSNIIHNKMTIIRPTPPIHSHTNQDILLLGIAHFKDIQVHVPRTFFNTKYIFFQ